MSYKLLVVFEGVFRLFYSCFSCFLHAKNYAFELQNLCFCNVEPMFWTAESYAFGC